MRLFGRRIRPMPPFRHFCKEDEECRCEENYDREVNRRIDEWREERDDSGSLEGRDG